MAEEKKKFLEASKSAGLKSVSISKLAEEDFDTIAAIKAMTEEDVSASGLTRGQTRLLQSWIKSLNTQTTSQPSTSALPPPTSRQSDGPDPTQTAAPVTNADLTQNNEMQRLLGQLNTNGYPGDGLFGTDATGPSDGSDKRSAGKALLIPDFVTRPTQGGVDTEDTELCE